MPRSFPSLRRALAAAAGVVVLTLAGLGLAGPVSASAFTDYAADPSLSGEHADLFRLYWAFFDREPDLSGAQYWVGEWNKCVAIDVITDSFYQSPEFATYGTLTDSQLVDLVYQHVLHRTPDDGGRAYWLGQLASGDVDRPGLVYYFSQSAEFRLMHPLPSDGRPYGGCTPPPKPVPVVRNVSYANCDAVRAAGAAPLYRGQPGYSTTLDRDGDGIACEK